MMLSTVFKSLNARLSLALILLFALFFALCACLIVAASRKYEQEVAQRMHQDLAKHVVDHYLLFKNGVPDLNAAQETFHDLMVLGPNFEFYLLDADGRILTYSAPPGVVKQDKVQPEIFSNWRQQINEKGYVTNKDPRSKEGEKIFSVAPVEIDGKLQGYLYVVLGSQIRDQLEAQIWSSRMMTWGLVLFAAASLAGLLVLLVLVARITRPLARLTQQVSTIREQGFANSGEDLRQSIQNLSCWRQTDSNDIHALGNTFRLALERLEQQYQNVVSIDDLRKELLSHVSHDLRTPLASLLGYLETWEMQKNNLPSEQSDEYIAIAKRSAQKIAVLIEQLFELAQLDGDNVQVNLEPFSIAELIQDVLQKFTIQADAKQVQLSVQPQDSSILVRADIEKLERVFSNLIENALRHTPHQGSISVHVEQKSGFVSIHVSDTGIGIPEKDLPYVFDAHFKAGNSVRENTAHGGLGLAITKKLLELHSSAIKVQSKLNQGTTFSFALPLA